MRIKGGKELKLYRFMRFDKDGDYFVGIFDDTTNTVYGQSIIAYCLESSDQSIKPQERCLIYISAQISRWLDEIRKARIFSLEYRGKARSRHGRSYKVFDIHVYTKEDAVKAYPDLKDFIEDVLSVPF